MGEAQSVEERLAALRSRLRDDFPFYSRKCLKIVDADGTEVPFKLKDPQLRLWEKLKEQDDAGLPMRALILKARKIGFSTLAQALMLWRVTQIENHYALVVAQDRNTAGELFEKGDFMYRRLPGADDLGLKPPIQNFARGKFLAFGEPSKMARDQGDLGINSRYNVDTANEYEASRGFTYHSMHLSEVAFWPDQRKLTSILNTVERRPHTLILQESTANGWNHFKDAWDRAVEGRSSYIAHFEPWFSEPSYTLKFHDDAERAEFIASIGEGEFGEQEPMLQELGCTPEQLHWRRRKIEDDCEGDLRVFFQEYPSTANEAFLSSGEMRFNPVVVNRIVEQTKRAVEPERGILVPQSSVTMQSVFGPVEVPKNPKWVPEAEIDNEITQSSMSDELARFKRLNKWEVWQHPELPEDDDEEVNQFIAALDPAGGEESEVIGERSKRGEKVDRAQSAICVIDHRSRMQVAEFVSAGDADLVGVELYLAALYFNEAWAAPENQGGYGLSICRRLDRMYRYPWLYKTRNPNQAITESEERRWGWKTTRETKTLLEDGAVEALREGTHGIRSAALARELTTYMRDERGKTGPQKGKRSDRIIAWMICQQVAQERMPRSVTKGGPATFQPALVGSWR